MKTFKKFLLASILAIFGLANLSMFSTVYAQNGLSIYNEVIGANGKTMQGGSLKSAIAGGNDVVTNETGSALVNQQVLKLIGYIIDIFIVVGIAVGFVGGYKIMTSNDEKAVKEGTSLLLFGIIGIIIMVSANFFASSLAGDTGLLNEFVGGKDPNGIRFISSLYEKVLFPFIKVALYFVIGALFFMMAGKVVTFVTSTDDTAKKKAGGVIIRSIVGILIIMGAKQLVESVMGKQETVLNENAKWIDDQSPGSVLDFGSIPLVTQVINWVMGLTMFAILVLVIVQGYKLFTKPDDPKTRESLKKTLLYIIIGVLVIGASYAISSVLVINNVPITES